MTRSDIEISSGKVNRLLDKPNLSNEDKEIIRKTIIQHDSILDKLWCEMLDLNDIVEKSTYKNNQIDSAVRVIRDRIAELFGEKDYFGK